MATNMRIRSALPKDTSSEDRKDIRASVDALAKVAEKIAPEGTLLVSVHDKRSSFTPIVKVSRDLMDLEFIYNFQSIQRDPSLLAEYTEILENIKNIEKIVGKRKKDRNKRRETQKKRTEEK